MFILGTTHQNSETTSSYVLVKLLQFHKVNDFVKIHAAKTSWGGGGMHGAMHSRTLYYMKVSGLVHTPGCFRPG